MNLGCQAAGDQGEGATLVCAPGCKDGFLGATYSSNHPCAAQWWLPALL